MDVTAATNTPEMYTITASGTFTFDRNVGVRTSPFMAQSSAATYVAGESVNYDSKVKNDNHLWLSYIGASGNRVYVDYANIANNEYFGTDTNSTDPIQAGSEPTTGEGLGTLYERSMDKRGLITLTPPQMEQLTPQLGTSLTPLTGPMAVKRR